MSQTREPTKETLETFAKKTLAQFESKEYFATLTTLPATEPFKAHEKKDVPAALHPLVLIESQVTLYKIKTLLQQYSTNTNEVTEETTSSLQEILTNRYCLRLHDPEKDAQVPNYSESFFYGAPIPHKANDACIDLAATIQTALTPGQNETYVYRLIPGLEKGLDNNIDLKQYHMTYLTDSSSSAIWLVKNEEDAAHPTDISSAASNMLYDILYTMVTIPDLINRLYESIPQNTWRLYLSCLSTHDLLCLAIDKPEKKPDEFLTDEEYKKVDDLIEKKLLKEPGTAENQYTLKCICSTHQARIRDAINAKIKDKQCDEKWIKAAYFVSISLSARVRDLLPDYLGYGGRLTGYSKETRLQEANALLEFLMLDEPLKKLPEWLETHHKDVKGRLTSYSGGKYSTTYYALLEHGKQLEQSLTPEKPAATSGWFRFGWS